ncbi:MAG: hypothetical protein ACR2HN_00530 [Tepidiformaceae bacterium]
MRWFRRKPRIDEGNYGRLMTSFGRVVDGDPFVGRPAGALAERVVGEEAEAAAALDGRMYRGATVYHLRLLAGAWIMSRDGNVPAATAEVFEEAVVWKFGPLVKGSGRLAHRVSVLARGEGERELGVGDDGR